MLIPKKEKRAKVPNHKLISHYNVFYKFISKLFVNKLHMLLPNIICPFQSACVPSRDINNNILIIHESLKTFLNLK